MVLSLAKRSRPLIFVVPQTVLTKAVGAFLGIDLEQIDLKNQPDGLLRLRNGGALLGLHFLAHVPQVHSEVLSVTQVLPY